MNDKNLHIDQIKEKSAEFFSKGKIDWNKPEELVWEELFARTQKTAPKGKSVVFPRFYKYAAAVIMLLVIAGTIPFIYTKSVESVPGEHVLATLPDGSTIELNAGSHIKYYPLKWFVQRKVIFEGEAFFQVQKGKKFDVQSKNGTTEVLGTSFNVYSRDGKYRVTCITGKVKVETVTKQSVILLPGSQAKLERGKLVVERNVITDNIISWKNNQFFFAGTPLHEVIDEIERQYGVTIKIQDELYNRNFAGNFPKKYSVEEVLDFVCKTMQVKFVKQSENVFLVVENS
ncbi:MAG TPA: FecR domain-containing protein [Draconibacterium sp.]|nr:FecR domain-containing protein [Draconibacterium sp.]